MKRAELNKTKIVCTIGPRVNSPEMLSQLISAGMNVARINFSHGTHQEHKKTILMIREVAAKSGAPIAILQDLSGPKLRIGTFRDDKTVSLKTGNKYILTTRKIEGDENAVSFPYPKVIADIKPGDMILLADGMVQLKTLSIKDGSEVITEVMNDGELSSHKGINFPNTRLQIPSMTRKDKEDLEFGLNLGVDFIALSFVREAADILNLKNIISFFNKEIPVIAKIEKHEAIDNLKEIVDVSDGLMVARGDLGVEMPLEQVPWIQKEIIYRANLSGKPVITATQMLRSMVENPRPTRAEVTDVANAIWDGTDAVMLSEETAIGKYPIESVTALKKIAIETEGALTFLEKRQHKLPEMLHNTIRDGIASGVHFLDELLHPKAILTPTITGTTAKLISRLQPSAPVIAFTPNEVTFRKLALSWGVIPILSEYQKGFSDLVSKTIKNAKKRGYLNKGDKVIIALGYPPGEERTDTIKVVECP